MTPHPALGQQSQGTGDLNLTAALMAVGIPLDPAGECTEIHKDNGRSYGRWFLLPQSLDGKHDCHRLSRVWSGLDTLPANHPFAWIMAFIAGRPQGCITEGDWLAYAHDHCRELGLDTKLSKAVLNPTKDVETFGDSRQAYVFAFVSCRGTALAAYNKIRRHQVMMSRGQAHAIIDHKLPGPQRNELLSRLEGQ